MPTEQKDLKEFLKPLLWDVKLSPAEAEKLLLDQAEEINGIRKYHLLTKMFMSYKWSVLLTLLSREQLHQALNDQRVINSLFPPSLKNLYQYAARFF